MPGPADKDGGGGEGRRAPYAQHMVEIYQNAIIAGTLPPVTTDPNKLEEQARQVMEPGGFGYVAGGAGAGDTVEANRLAFKQWRLVPRFLRPTQPRDLRVELFGKTYDSPVLMAPVGVQSAYHAEAETGTATACAELGVPFIFSTASSTPLEEVARAADDAAAAAAAAAAEEYLESEPESKPAPPVTAAPAPAPRWFQLYRPRDDDLTASFLQRAKDSGCGALVVTLDTFTLAWRPRDLDAGYLPFATGTGNALAFSDAAFRRKFAAPELGDGDAPEDNPVAASRYWTGEAFGGQAHSWGDLRGLRRMWGADRPMLLKGVLSVEDARLALEHGMDGIIVSNHGGRQLDGAVAALDVLPEIVDAVGDRMTVLFDSGVRTGADIIKALALGAKAVLVGRPVIYGLGIAGKDGAKSVLAGLLADLDQSMGLAGAQKVSELNRSMLRRAPYGAEIKSVL